MVDKNAIKEAQDLNNKINRQNKFDIEIPAKEEESALQETVNANKENKPKPNDNKMDQSEDSDDEEKEVHRRTYDLHGEVLDKLQLMKTFSSDKSATYNKIIEKGINTLWRLDYQDKYGEVLKSLRD